MQAILDLPAVRRFTADLSARLRQCDNGEGMICSNLEESIKYYVHLGRELRVYLVEWARAVFAGQIAFDPEAELLLKNETRHLLHRAKQLAALGRAMDEECFKLEGLGPLHHYIAALDFLLENWVSPRRAVSPAPRVKIPAAVRQEIVERLSQLSPLPSDWRPTDPAQLAFFKKQRSE